jgi:hypothetical protein
MRIAVVISVVVTVSVFVALQEVTVSNLVTNMIPEDGVTGITVKAPESLFGLSMVVPLGAVSAACVVCGSAVVSWVDDL